MLKHGQFVLGPEVAELERQLAGFCGAKHCVTCANGTDALTLALMAEGVGKGDAVFVPAFTFVATVEVAVLCGATPVFVDIRRDTFNMDIESLEAAIGGAKKRGLKPRCVIPVDLYGQPADYNAVNEIAKAHGMFVIGDAAQSFGASLAGRKVGTLAAYTATSFYPSKPLGGYGDGGAVFTDDDDKALRLLALRNHGKGPAGQTSNMSASTAGSIRFRRRSFCRSFACSPRDPGAAGKGRSLQSGARFGGRGAASDAGRHFGLGPIHHHHRGIATSLAKACREAGVPTAIHYTRPRSIGCRRTGKCPTPPAGVRSSGMAGRAA